MKDDALRYDNIDPAVEARVNALLDQMTLAEKIGAACPGHAVSACPTRMRCRSKSSISNRRVNQYRFYDGCAPDWRIRSGRARSARSSRHLRWRADQHAAAVGGRRLAPGRAVDRGQRRDPWLPHHLPDPAGRIMYVGSAPAGTRGARGRRRGLGVRHRLDLRADGGHCARPALGPHRGGRRRGSVSWAWRWHGRGCVASRRATLRQAQGQR